MPHSTRTLLYFLAAAALLAGACLIRAEQVPAPAAVPAAATPLTREFLLASLAHDLSNHFKLEGELQLELNRAWTFPTRLASQWDVAVLEYPAVAASSMLVRCQVLADRAIVAETTFVLRASHWREGWFTRQPVVAGTRFEASALEPRRVDFFRDRDALPSVVGDASFNFNRSVPAGRLLNWNDVARRPLVKKGELVEVSAADGLLLVSMKALAMENGARGATITVRNPDSRKDFAAMVIDENRVQVRF